MEWVAKKEAEREAAVKGETAVKPAQWWKDHFKNRKKREKEDLENAPRENDDLLISTLRPFLPPSPSSPLPDRSSSLSIWDALHSLRQAHPTILDRFQPLYRLRFFHRASVPAIDYFTAKYSLLYLLIEDKRSHAESEFEPASTAFVTFRSASDARRARQELRWRPIRRLYHGRVLDCKVSLAPEVRDLHWHRLCLVSLQSDLARGLAMPATPAPPFNLRLPLPPSSPAVGRLPSSRSFQAVLLPAATTSRQPPLPILLLLPVPLLASTRFTVVLALALALPSPLPSSSPRTSTALRKRLATTETSRRSLFTRTLRAKGERRR
jgi:hypothetical protein